MSEIKQHHADKRNMNSIVSNMANEKGVALVMAMVMIVLLSILGAMSLSTSTIEIGISGNYRNSMEALYAAERAVEYAATNGSIYTTIGTSSTVENLKTGAHPANISITTSGGRTSGLDLDANATNEVQFLSSGALPPGSGSDPDLFGANYYLISVTGSGPNSVIYKIEAQIARVVPK